MKKIAAADAIRGLAATYVFASHFIRGLAPESSWTLPFRFGQEAVMLFFLLSGFVIMYSMETAADKSFRTYLSRRFLRIYPIFLLALVISYALSKSWVVDLPTLAGNIFMLQDYSGKPGILFDTFEGNLPLWSLSYEWWFYLMFFPVYRYLQKRMQIQLITAVGVSAVVAYNALHFQPLLFLAYFPIWWAGAEMGRSVSRHEPIPFAAILTSLGILSTAFAICTMMETARGYEFSFGNHPILELRHALAALAIVLGLFVYRRQETVRLERLIMPFAAIAPISYGIYALHSPVCAFLDALSLPARIPAAIIAVVAISWFAEFPYQQFVRRLLMPRLVAPQHALTFRHGVGVTLASADEG
jgi:peptidoglycan/LPS O-acetylase OafA/YrhL